MSFRLLHCLAAGVSLLVAGSPLQDEGAPALIRRLGSVEVKVRERAQQDLVRLGAKALPALEKAVKTDDPEVRSRATRIIKEIRRNQRAETLRRGISEELLKEAPNILRHGTSESREAWLGLLEDISGRKSSIDKQPFTGKEGVFLSFGTRKQASTTRKDFVALTLSYALGSWRDERVEGLIYAIADKCEVTLPEKLARMRRAFEDADHRVPDWLFSMGGRFVGRSGRPATAAIQKLSKSDADPWNKVAQQALRKNRKKSIAALCRLLRYEDEAVQVEAIWKLNGLTAEGVAPVLSRCLDISSVKVQVAAAMAIGRMKLKDGEKALIQRANDPALRLHVIRSLSQLGLPGSVPTLEKALEDENWRIRYAALDGLALAQSESSVKKIVALLNDADDSVRSKAIQALGTLPAADAADAILECLKKPDLLYEVMDAVGRIGIKRAVPLILQRLDDIDSSVRDQTALALARLGSQELLAHPDALIGKTRRTSERLLWELNRYSQPKTARKVREARLSPRNYRGTVGELVGAWSKHTGIKIEIALPEKAKDKMAELRTPIHPITLEEALFSLMPSHQQFTLLIPSPGVLRIVCIDTALDHWRAWLAKRENR